MKPEHENTCLFCRLAAAGTLPLVWEEKDFMAFLDHRPLFPGHCLLIPRPHVETLADLPASKVAAYFKAAQRLARAVEKLPGAEGSFLGINNRVSQSVPHLHTHVVPRRKGDGLKGFFWPRTRYADEAEMRSMAERLKKLI